MPRVTVGTPLCTAQMASANWRALQELRWCRRTAAAASCTGPTPASKWPNRWRRLWRAEKSTRLRSTFTRRTVGAYRRSCRNKVDPSCSNIINYIVLFWSTSSLIKMKKTFFFNILKSAFIFRWELNVLVELWMQNLKERLSSALRAF